MYTSSTHVVAIFEEVLAPSNITPMTWRGVGGRLPVMQTRFILVPGSQYARHAVCLLLLSMSLYDSRSFTSHDWVGRYFDKLPENGNILKYYVRLFYVSVVDTVLENTCTGQSTEAGAHLQSANFIVQK